jgi:hypothetical protein
MPDLVGNGVRTNNEVETKQYSRKNGVGTNNGAKKELKNIIKMVKNVGDDGTKTEYKQNKTTEFSEQNMVQYLPLKAEPLRPSTGRSKNGMKNEKSGQWNTTKLRWRTGIRSERVTELERS